MSWLITGVGIARQLSWLWVIGAGALGVSLSKRTPRIALLAVLVGIGGGWLANLRQEAQTEFGLPAYFDGLEVVALTDSSEGRYGDVWAVASAFAFVVEEDRHPWQGPNLTLDLPPGAVFVRGDRYRITGIHRQTRFKVDEVERLSGPSDPLTMAGNSLRRLVLDTLERDSPEEALLAGFLVGDTSALPESDYEALRAAGLSHFVAVSGSNVAGFLLLFWIVLGPLGVGARRRGFLGLAALFVFAVATRWEPSVVRASLMAGVVLAARAIGLAVDQWVALGIGVGLAVVVSPGLITDLGFQLSVAATAGIMLGADSLPASMPGWLRKPLGVGVAAQIAVAPILLLSFGEIPLFAPVTNLVAAPLVAFATLLSAVGVITSLDTLIDVAAQIAGVFLWIGSEASWLPQVSTIPAMVLVLGVGLFVRVPRVRPVLVGAASLVLVFLLVGETGLQGPAVAFLDIGQGDAALIATRDGRRILIDAGPDPRELWRALRRHRIKALDLVVATHPHDDHIGGLMGLAGRIPIGLVWYSGERHESITWDLIESELNLHGVPLQVPSLSTSIDLGEVTVEVLGPERHYEDPNDESIVLLVQGPGVSVLMTGDIEIAAQTDIFPVDVDVLKVPHHGGATSRNEWIIATTPRVAVVSVGENDFGHPHPSIIETLSTAGVEIRRTDQDGDVVISLDALA